MTSRSKLEHLKEQKKQYLLRQGRLVEERLKGGNEIFCSSHTKFEKEIRCPKRDVKQVGGYVVFKFTEEARAGEKIGSYISSLDFTLTLLFLISSSTQSISSVHVKQYQHACLLLLIFCHLYIHSLVKADDIIMFCVHIHIFYIVFTD